jgi:Right handed beta helix region
MCRSILGAVLCCGVVLFCLNTSPAAAQATRTWVSAVGDDANPCSRTAPCKTFAGAISKTAAKGIISVLDPGGFGAVTITKAISIQTDPAYGSVLASGVNGIVINAGPADDVFLNGLIVDGAGAGLSGIEFLAGKSLTVTDCIIRGFVAAGGAGVLVSPTAGTATVTVSHCTVTGNVDGIRVDPAGSGRANVFLDDVVLESNTGSGLIAVGSRSSVMINALVVTNNAKGLKTAGKSTIASFGNNAVGANAKNGAPTATVPLK